MRTAAEIKNQLAREGITVSRTGIHYHIKTYLVLNRDYFLKGKTFILTEPGASKILLHFYQRGPDSNIIE